MKYNISTKKIVMAITFLTIGWLLPFFTMQIPEIGSMLCPMHIPVFLCGFILGPWYGMLIGFMTPITRTFIFGMPVLFPTSVCMMFELATYGFISGYLWKKSKHQQNNLLNLLIILVTSMIFGRIVFAISKFLTGIFTTNNFAFNLLIIDAFISSWLGILIQLFFIPLIISIFEKVSFLQDILNDSSISIIKKQIDVLLSKNEKVVIAIDGMAASGKTTLAIDLTKIYDARVIHLDDFFLPSNLRNDERYHEIGGNIHYERLKEEVIDKLDSDIEYKKFNCEIMTYDDIIKLPYKKLTIIEGSYALHLS